ncbi:hypothetical protein HNI00_18085 [Thermoleptolyngbya oregonensis NK1-22]|uniref:Uncharacterized protein n=1 Tax=Thermoleptolyngbya oregonensis NK1-22 TaxID=2547457 RepID=A0AA97BR19_9CYAN|nr:hypothetical protein [Thermoleptolyngbya oregonensis]WOB44848.1 hypothetical protein HNI00_18085 [Thermoleptolyngbya oregonensis NK1-22]
MKLQTAMQANATNRENRWFPEIDSIATARRVARQGVIASLVLAGVTTAFAIAATQNTLPSELLELDEVFNPLLFVDALIYGAIAWGIQRMSRIAAIAGLSIYLLSRVLLHLSGMPTNLFGMAIVTLVSVAFINAIRSTFAYHRFQRQQALEMFSGNSDFPEAN